METSPWRRGLSSAWGSTAAGWSLTWQERSSSLVLSTPTSIWRAPWSPPVSSSRRCCPTAPPPSSPIPTRSPTSWGPTASNTCCRPPRACRWTCASCCPPACPPRLWMRAGRCWTTGPSTPSTTTPESRGWRR